MSMSPSDHLYFCFDAGQDGGLKFRLRSLCGTVDTAELRTVPTLGGEVANPNSGCANCNEKAAIERRIFAEPATHHPVAQLRASMMLRVRYHGYRDGVFALRHADSGWSASLALVSGKGVLSLYPPGQRFAIEERA